MYRRNQKSPSDNSPTQLKSSQLVSRSTVQAKQNSPKSLSQSENEKEVNRQNRSEVSRLGHNIANIPISSPHKQDSAIQSKSAIQAKLTISEPGDKYEREADSIAAQVMKQIYSPQFQQQGQAVQPIEALEEEQELQTKPKITSLQRMEAGVGEEESTDLDLEPAINSARSDGQPLDPSFQQLAGQVMGVDFHELRIHTGPRANQLARSMGARAFAFRKDLFFGKGEFNTSSRDGQELALHEMAHYAQQNPETVQRSPQKNEGESQSKTLKTVSSLSRQSAIEGKAVQRYKIVKSGSNEYPIKKESKSFAKDKEVPNDEFFVSQEEKDGSFLSNNKDEQGTYTPNLVYESSVNLMVADNYDLAIETTDNQAKVFFATDEQIKKSNNALKGQTVELKTTGRYLQITSGDGIKKKLYQVEPLVKGNKAAGVNVRTPQRCNEMAEFVTGKKGLYGEGLGQSYSLIAQTLDILANDNPNVIKDNNYVERLDNLTKLAPSNPQKISEYDELLDEMSVEFVKFKNNKDKFRPSFNDIIDREIEIDEIMENKKANQFMNPVVGDAMMISSMKTKKQTRETEEVPYHFGGVVAKSGSDYITMENYYRNDKKNRSDLSGGDSLFFFKMYGSHTPDREQTWHEKNRHNFSGAIISIVVK